MMKAGLLVVGFLVCAACGKTVIADEGIDIVSGLQNLQELKASDYFSRLRFVPLETPEDALIGRRPQWQVTDQYVIVSTQNQCFLFEKESGRFLRRIGHTGEDPEAYRSEHGIVDAVNDRMFFRGDRGTVVEYGLDGKWKGKFTRPAPEAENLPSFFPLAGDTLVGLFEDMTGGQKERLMIYTKAGDSILCLPNESPLPSFEMTQISVINRFGEVDIAGLTGMQGLLFVGGEDPEIGSVTFLGHTPFWKYKGKTYLKEVYNDTIYQVSTQGLRPHTVFHLGEHHWPAGERFRKDKDKAVSVLQVMETGDLFFFRLAFAVYSKEKQKYYNGIYHKSTGSVHINHLAEGVTDDIYDFFPLYPIAVSPSGQLMAVLSAEEIAMWIDENGASALPADLAHLVQVREDDNPVLVFIE